MAVLRILFRRSLLLWAIPIWLGFYVAALLSRGAPWRGDPAWGTEAVGVFLMFTGTVLSAMVAWEAASRDAALLTITSMASRGKWHPVLRAAVGWALATIGYLCAVLVVLIASCLNRFAVNNFSPVPVVTGSLSLLAAASWGVLIGRRVSGVFAPAVAGVSYLLLEYLDYAGLLPLGLAEEGATSTLLGVHYSLTHFLVRVLWIASFIGLCLLLAGMAKPWAKAISVVSLIAMTLVTAALPAAAEEAYAVDQYLDPTACAGSEVTICVIPQWSSQLPTLVTLAEGTQAALLRETSVSLKAKYVGWTPGSPQSEDTIDVVRLDSAGQPASTSDVVQELVAPQSCSAWSDPDVIPPDRAFDGRTLLTKWILSQPELESMVGTGRNMPKSLAALTNSERTDYLTKVATGLMSCNFSKIPARPGS